MTIAVPQAGPEEGFVLIPLASQLQNHDEYCRPSTDALAGRNFDVEGQDGGRLSIRMRSGSELTWRVDGGDPSTEPIVEHYDAVELRPDIFFMVVARLDERVSCAIVADLEHGRLLANVTRFEGANEDVCERTTYLHCRIAGTNPSPFPRTTELVGKRVHHRYSSTHAFEHIYLNPNTYVFHCLEGPEAGLADVDRCDMFKLADQLYLLSWHERSQPFNGAVCVDLALERATGRLVGWDPAKQAALQARTGTTATLLNISDYTGL